jgi:hypothetical protein
MLLRSLYNTTGRYDTPRACSVWSRLPTTNMRCLKRTRTIHPFALCPQWSTVHQTFPIALLVQSPTIPGSSKLQPALTSTASTSTTGLEHAWRSTSPAGRHSTSCTRATTSSCGKMSSLHMLPVTYRTPLFGPLLLALFLRKLCCRYDPDISLFIAISNS